MNDIYTILIIEDEDAHAQAIKRAIISYSSQYNVVVAYSIKEYHAIIQSTNPCLILSDINLPDGNALEVMANAKENHFFPLVVMTSFGDEAIAVQAIKLGALDYIVKSEQSFREIPRLIERWIREWHNIEKRAMAEAALKESEARYRLLAENINDTVWLTDLELKTIYISPSASKTRGYDQEELMAMPFEQHMVPASARQATSFIRAALKEDNLLDAFPNLTSTMELEFYKKNGTTLWCETVFSIIMNDENRPIHILGSIRDVSERKWAENMLQMQTDELKKAKEKAEESDRLKSSFLANLSHEIRTPMNGILGFADFLRDPWLPVEKRNKYIDIINSSSKQLLGIITDIIEISKIENNLVVLMKNNVRVNTVINSLYSNFIISIPKGKSINLQVNKDLPDSRCILETDEVKLYQVLSNLVENAIKYTDSGNVEFGYKICNQEIVFYVKDTGIGVAAEYHQVIFDRFRRVEMTQATELKGGTGLGLAISKAYVEMLGGRIWIESSPGQGSTFYFSFPFSHPILEEHTTETSSHEKRQFDLDNCNILIAEDDDVNYMYLEELLSETHAVFDRAKDGKETLAKYNRNAGYNVILMDIKMPYMNGLEVTAEIRKSNPTIPIIAQTAYAFEEEKQKAMEMGCNDYIAKPIKKEELLELIAKYV